MREGAREAILGRLRAARRGEDGAAPSDFAVVREKRWPEAERLPRLRRLMEAAHAEFLEATGESWPSAVRDLLVEAGARNVMVGAGSAVEARLAEAWSGLPGGPELLRYDRPVEELKGVLFGSVDAGLTTCEGGLAETGSLVVVPTPEEPRLLSLVPPIHLVLLDPATVRDGLWQLLAEPRFANGMPPNALLISGPSKTADIEQTLAYGVHGPKRLVVVVVPGGATPSRGS